MDTKLIFLEHVRKVIRIHHLSSKTEQAYLDWIYRFILFHHNAHPQEIGEKEISAFLSFLAVDKKFSASTQNQALNALIFLYRHVLERDLENLDYAHASGGNLLPVSLSRREIRQILLQLEGNEIVHLIVSLLYGSGLRLNECLRLRVRNVDFQGNKIIVCDDKGDMERQTLLPRKLKSRLKSKIEQLRIKLQKNLLRADFEGCSMAEVLEQKIPNSAKELKWQYVFFSQKLSADPILGKFRQHHLHASSVQKMVKKAVIKAGISQHITCRTFRNSFAVHLLEDGYDIHTVQELLGHQDVRSTRLYMHGLTKNVLNVRSPLDI